MAIEGGPTSGAGIPEDLKARLKESLEKLRAGAPPGPEAIPAAPLVPSGPETPPAPAASVEAPTKAPAPDARARRPAPGELEPQGPRKFLALNESNMQVRGCFEVPEEPLDDLSKTLRHINDSAYDIVNDLGAELDQAAWEAFKRDKLEPARKKLTDIINKLKEVIAVRIDNWRDLVEKDRLDVFKQRLELARECLPLLTQVKEIFDDEGDLLIEYELENPDLFRKTAPTSPSNPPRPASQPAAPGTPAPAPAAAPPAMPPGPPQAPPAAPGPAAMPSAPTGAAATPTGAPAAPDTAPAAPPAAPETPETDAQAAERLLNDPEEFVEQMNTIRGTLVAHEVGALHDKDLAARLEAFAALPPEERTPAAAQQLVAEVTAYDLRIGAAQAILDQEAPEAGAASPEVAEQAAMRQAREALIAEAAKLRPHSRNLSYRLGGFWARFRAAHGFAGASLAEMENGLKKILFKGEAVPEILPPEALDPADLSAPPRPPTPEAIAQNRTEFVTAVVAKGLKAEEAEALYDSLRARNAHNKARGKCGQAMMDAKRSRQTERYERIFGKPQADWTPAQTAAFEEEMGLYKTRKVIPQITDQESIALKDAGLDSIPPDKRGQIVRMLDWYNGLSKPKRLLLGLTISSAFVGLTGGFAATGIIGGVALRAARGVLSIGASYGGGKAWERMTKGASLRIEAGVREKIDALLKDRSFDNIEALDEEYGEIMAEKARFDREVLLGKMVVVGGAGLLTTIATGYAAKHPIHSGNGNISPLEKPKLGANLGDPNTGGGPDPNAASPKSIDASQATAAEGGPGGGFVETASNRGDSWWRLAERQLNAHYGDQFTGPHGEAQRTWVLDTLKHRMGASELRLELNDKINFSSTIGDPEEMRKLIEDAHNLSPEKIANIERNLGIGTGSTPGATEPVSTAGARSALEITPESSKAGAEAVSLSPEATLANADVAVREGIQNMFESGNMNDPHWSDHDVRLTLGHMYDVDPAVFDNPLVREAVLLHPDLLLDPEQVRLLEQLHAANPEATTVANLTPDAATARIDNPLVKHWVDAHPNEQIPADLAARMEWLNNIRERYRLGDLEQPRVLNSMRALDHVIPQYSAIKHVRLGDLYDQVYSSAEIQARPELARVAAMGIEPVTLPTVDGVESKTFLTQNLIGFKDFLVEKVRLNDELRNLTVQDFSEAMYGALDKNR